MDLEQMYQRTILAYAKRRDHHHALEDATAIERGHNPSCGDDLTLLLKEAEGRITAASFLGEGCAISTASTNMLIDLIVGEPVAQVQAIVEAFFKQMKEEALTSDEAEALGDAQVLAFAASMPARIKCATLSWHALKVILERETP